MKSNLAFEPATLLRSQLEEGSVSPHDILDNVLSQIKRNEPRVHAYLYLEKEEVLRRQADRSESRIKNGTAGKLEGIPLAVKDNMYVKGMPCTGGSKILSEFFPTEDAFVVAALRNEGAIFVGKTNLDELAAFGIATDNPWYGRTYNPWNIEKIPGGSSGGSAAAVASGESVVALGSDTGGSVRIPASFCGVVGLKPTYGRVGRTGSIAMSWSLDHLGVISRSVRDSALMLDVMSRFDDNDSAMIGTHDYQTMQFTDNSDLAGMKIGVLSNPICRYDTDVSKVFDSALDKFSSVGALVDEFTIPGLEQVTPLIFAIALPETSAFHEDWFRKYPDKYGEKLRSMVQLGYTTLATQYLRAQRVRTLLVKEIGIQLKKVDAVVMPTAPSIAPNFGQENIMIEGKEYPAFEVLTQNTYPFNFYGVPALSIPIGFSQGLPVGLQLVTSHFEENKLFKIADAFQRVTDFHRQHPRSMIDSA